jgi:Recombinase
VPDGQTNDEKQVLAIIADARTAEYSYRAIAEELNTKGYATRSGSAWRPQYVASISPTALCHRPR